MAVSFRLPRTSCASPKETLDLVGAPDPGKQMDYSPIEELIHRYELGLIYVASTCSAHCRFCYHEELIAKKSASCTADSVAGRGAYLGGHSGEARLQRCVHFAKALVLCVDEKSPIQALDPGQLRRQER